MPLPYPRVNLNLTIVSGGGLCFIVNRQFENGCNSSLVDRFSL